MMFHHKLDVKLITLVRKNPELYDHNNPNYMDSNAKEVAWQKIGDQLQRSGVECKIRWINIRDVYRRILKKNLESGQRQKTYKYDSELMFLRPFFKDVTFGIGVETSYEYDEMDNEQNITEDYNLDDPDPESENSDESFKKPITISVSRKSGAKRKKKKLTYEDVVDPIPIPISTTYSETVVPAEYDPSDPVDAFLISIGATLKTFSPYHLNVAKSKIFSVVQEHDLQQIVENQQHGDISHHEMKISTSDEVYLQ